MSDQDSGNIRVEATHVAPGVLPQKLHAQAATTGESSRSQSVASDGESPRVLEHKYEFGSQGPSPGDSNSGLGTSPQVANAGPGQENGQSQTYSNARNGGFRPLGPGASAQGFRPRGSNGSFYPSRNFVPRGGHQAFNNRSWRQDGRQGNYNQGQSRNSQVGGWTNGGGSSQAFPPDLSVYSNVRLELQGLSSDETTWSIWDNFEALGNIVFLELDDINEGSTRGRCARVIFEPPPADTGKLAGGSFRLTKSKGAPLVKVVITLNRRDGGSVMTPLRNLCPESVQLLPKQITFGMLTGPTTVMNKMTLEASKLGQESSQNLTVNFKFKKVTIYFSTDMGELAGRQMRADINFSLLTGIKMFRVELPGDRWALIMTLDEPPVWWRKRTAKVSHHDQRLTWSDMDLWVRVVEIAVPGTEPTRSDPYSLDAEDQLIDPGRWITFWVELDQSDEKKWHSLEGFLRDWNITVQEEPLFRLVENEKAPLWDYLLEPQQSKSNGASASVSDWHSDLATLEAIHVALPFDVRYQLEVCISHGVFSEYNVTLDFLQHLDDLTKKQDGSPWDRARLVLEYAADQGRRIFDPMSLFSNQAALNYQSAAHGIPSYCALVRKVVVTPTRMYFNTPSVETTNRVIRQYQSVQDSFLRVQFTDEMSKGRIDGCDVDRDNEIYARTFRFLQNGLRMGHWHWQFLAFGNSQIRENGAYLFCQPTGSSITCDSIRAWMGDFSHIKVVAKYAARLGQCFSTTRQIRGLLSPQVVDIPDVERNGFCFTDGVGKMSNFVASMISSDFKLPYVPSVLQFRMGGSKGVLVQWPDVKRNEVHIRGSQTKFSAQSNGLEIIRTSAFSSATLNRQTITILSSLGVPDAAFTTMTDEQLTGYLDAMKNEDKAIQLLGRFVDENSMTITMRQMVRDGFMRTEEPFVRALLQLWKTWSIKALKEKARLIVEKGAFVLGCVDETSQLRGHSRKTEGRDDLDVKDLPQIFIQVPDQETGGGAYKVIEGPCLVGRNPSLHPGDIRVVEAVDVPALGHIRDAVVFPMDGDRDIPSMCSGGDLDGDDFFVLWEPTLLPPRREWGTRPMNYKSEAPPEEENGVLVKDLIKFFSYFMKCHSLPLIAHAHLGMADREPKGAKAPICKLAGPMGSWAPWLIDQPAKTQLTHGTGLELANLHSKAVDYVKTGEPAIFDRKKHEPTRWPHWMEKKNSYRSRKVLGQIYEKMGKLDFQPTYDMPFDKRILCSYTDVDTAVLQKARHIKCQYDTAMRRLMGQMEIGTEFEVWSTFVLSKPRVGSGYKLQETLGHESSALKQRYRDMCKQAAGGQERERLLPFVAAMYRVTWEEVQIALREASEASEASEAKEAAGKPRNPSAKCMPLISFPWLFDAHLGRIALSHQGSDVSAVVVPDLVEYTRAADGVVVHRAEHVKLFHDEDQTTLWDAAARVVTAGDEVPKSPELGTTPNAEVDTSAPRALPENPSKQSDPSETCISEPSQTCMSAPASSSATAEGDEMEFEEDVVTVPEGPSAMDRLARLMLDNDDE